MERKARVNVYMEKSLLVTAKWSDFDGDVQQWKDAIYELFRYQMTWSFAHQIELIDSRNSGVFVSIHCRPAYKENLLDTMEDLCFRNVNVTSEEIGVIECTDLPEDMLIDFAIVGY